MITFDVPPFQLNECPGIRLYIPFSRKFYDTLAPAWTYVFILANYLQPNSSTRDDFFMLIEWYI